MKAVPVRRVFLDNHVFIYAFEKKTEPVRSKVLAMLEPNSSHLVLSEESLVEFSLSERIDSAIGLTKSALAHAPLWIRSFLDIQRDEVRNYVVSHYLRQPVKPIEAIVASFSQLFPDAKCEVEPIEFVRAAFREPNRSEMTRKHLEHAAVLKKLQDSQKSGAYNMEVDRESTQRVIYTRLPHFQLRQLGRSDLDVREVLDYCVKTKAKLYKACPSLNTERHLSDYRFSNPNRSPRPSDSKDLTLSCAAFPYVDEFATQDGYLIGGLQYVRAKVLAIHTSINTLQ